MIIGSIALAWNRGLAHRISVGFVVDPILTAIFLTQVIAMGNTNLWGWLNWKVIRYLGQISYGMFLYHMLANHLVVILIGEHSHWLHVPAVILLAALLGTASYYLIEQRFLRLKSRFTAKRVASPAVYSDQVVIYKPSQTGSPEVNWKST